MRLLTTHSFTKDFNVVYVYKEVFKAVDVFTAPHFTATEASPAAKRTRILSMTQHA
jgi:hypothetical protein